MAAHSRHLRANPRFEPNFRQLIDFTAVEKYQVTRTGIGDVAKINPLGNGARRATLMPNSLGFGLARMYEQLRPEVSWGT